MSERVFLFDVDGVLVDPIGYRKVTAATIGYFAERMGAGERYPGDEVMEEFEARSITSEWDICALCLAGLLNAAQAAHPEDRLPGDLMEACEAIRGWGSGVPDVDTAAIAERLAFDFQTGLTFAEEAYRLSQPGQPGPLFPRLAGHALLEQVLAHSRDVVRSPVTRIFQEFAIGSKAFTETYLLPAAIQSEALLGVYDRPLLDKDLAALVRRGWENGQIHPVAYTVRPSLVRQSEKTTELACSPEAEMALEMVGLEGIPLVGYGQVCQLAQSSGLPADQIAKPSMIHALGAIGAAVTRDAARAMMDAARWAGESAAPGIFGNLPGLDITVFEDSPWSIRAVQQAGELLMGMGTPARVSAYGISRSPVKVMALLETGAVCVPDINTALRRALGLGEG
jgi:hypothetical protein